jgi:hypothetical protein
MINRPFSSLGHNGGKTYKLHISPNAPAKNFWSFMVYDPANPDWNTIMPYMACSSRGSTKRGVQARSRRSDHRGQERSIRPQ